MSSIEVIYYDIAGNRVTWPCTQTYLTCVITRYVSIHHLFKVRCNDITKPGGEVRNGILRCCLTIPIPSVRIVTFLTKEKLYFFYIGYYKDIILKYNKPKHVLENRNLLILVILLTSASFLTSNIDLSTSSIQPSYVHKFAARVKAFYDILTIIYYTMQYQGLQYCKNWNMHNGYIPLFNNRQTCMYSITYH